MTRLLAKLLLSIALGAALLYFVIVRMLPDEREPFAAVWRSVRSVGVWGVVVYALSFALVHVARTLRWVAQVRPLGETDSRRVFRVALIGYAAIVAFPWRLGEAVRPLLLARQSEKVTFSQALGTAVTERILDGLLITGLLFVAILTAPIAASPLVRNAGWISFVVFASATVTLGLFAAAPRWSARFAEITVGRVLPGFARRVVAMVTGFLDGLRSLASAGALGAFVGWTVVYWGANALGIWWFAHVFGLDVPVWAGFGLLAVLVVGIMVPGGPGFFGAFQLFLTEGLRLYLPAEQVAVDAFAFALTMNVIQLVIQLAFAVPALSTSGLGVRGLVRLQDEASRAEASSGS
jgi:uncharacterized protein (TIRG00374 family)